MIDDPGWREGSEISPMPVRGPDDSQRRSFTILKRDVATVFNSPEALTYASFDAWASK
jgi:hypothetical protein